MFHFHRGTTSIEECELEARLLRRAEPPVDLLPLFPRAAPYVILQPTESIHRYVRVEHIGHSLEEGYPGLASAFLSPNYNEVGIGEAYPLLKPLLWDEVVNALSFRFEFEVLLP